MPGWWADVNQHGPDAQPDFTAGGPGWQTGQSATGSGSRPFGPPFAAPGDPATTNERTEGAMKPNIHPEYVTTQVTCSCGNTFTTRSTAKGGSIHVETCSACHPFYTGKQRVLDTAGRVAKFQQKYAKVQARKAK
jgi:large subunit ribosomal protein L31